MIRDSRRKELPTRQQGETSDEKTQTSSRLWFGLKDPRIVRVSRAFGGKDRHSKVSTIRGLRDRRVRLSVPTAIQLYDLQDRLGLNQPSKVVDWLLNAAQHEIDKLPPLQMPPGNFMQFPQSSPASQVAAAHRQITSHPSDGARPLALFSSEANDEVFSKEAADKDLAAALPKLQYWQSDAPQKARQTEDLRETGMEKGGITDGNQAENEDIAVHYAPVSAAHASMVPRPNHSSTLALLGNAMSYAPCYNWEPSNNNLSHFGIHPSQVEAPSMSIPSSSLASQLVFCPSGAMPSMFHSYMTALNELDGKK